MKRYLLAAVAAAALLAAATLLVAEDAEKKTSGPGMAPEIPPSVQFGPDTPGLSLQDLRGKYVVVLFFQSWCPICNGWSGGVFKDVQDAAAGRQDVVLMAAKTDGGGVPAATRYLQGRADLAKWVVVADPDAVWTRAALGFDKLYHFMIVGPDGAMVDYGYSGNRIDNIFLPAERLKNLLKNAATDTVLPKDKKYPDVLAPIVRAAELRQYAQAIALCAAAAKSPAKADAAALKEDLLKALEERVKALSETAGDANAESAKRMDALMELKKISKDLASTAAGKAAAKAVAASNKDKILQGEIQAYQEYMTIHQQAAKVKDFTHNSEFNAALKAVSEKHPNTKFGRMAADEVRRLSEVAKAVTESAPAPAIPRL